MSFFPFHSDRIRRITCEGKVIILVDYSGLKEADMIMLTNTHREMVLAQKSECYFIANYETTYGTPGYMKAAHEFTMATKPYIPKGAFLGIKGAKVALLKGVIYFLKVNFRAFENEEDAFEFLIS